MWVRKGTFFFSFFFLFCTHSLMKWQFKWISFHPYDVWALLFTTLGKWVKFFTVEATKWYIYIPRALGHPAHNFHSNQSKAPATSPATGEKFLTRIYYALPPYDFIYFVDHPAEEEEDQNACLKVHFMLDHNHFSLSIFFLIFQRSWRDSSDKGGDFSQFLNSLSITIDQRDPPPSSSSISSLLSLWLLDSSGHIPSCLQKSLFHVTGGEDPTI